MTATMHRNHLLRYNNNNNENSPSATNQLLEFSPSMMDSDDDELFMPIMPVPSFDDDAVPTNHERSSPPPVLLLPRLDHFEAPIESTMMMRNTITIPAAPSTTSVSSRVLLPFRPRPTEPTRRRPRKGRTPLKEITVDAVLR